MLERLGRTVNVTIVGYGCRGKTQTDLLLDMPDVKIVAVCDQYKDRTEEAANRVLEKFVDKVFFGLS